MQVDNHALLYMTIWNLKSLPVKLSLDDACISLNNFYTLVIVQYWEDLKFDFSQKFLQYRDDICNQNLILTGELLVVWVLILFVIKVFEEQLNLGLPKYGRVKGENVVEGIYQRGNDTGNIIWIIGVSCVVTYLIFSLWVRAFVQYHFTSHPYLISLYECPIRSKVILFLTVSYNKVCVF